MPKNIVIHADDCIGWNDSDKGFNGCNCVVDALARKNAEIAQLKEDYKRVCNGFNAMTREAERGYGTPEEMAELREMLETVKQDHHNEACMHIECGRIAETGERWGDGVTPSLAMRNVLQLWKRKDDLLLEVRRKDDEIDHLRTKFAALQEAVLALPEYDEPDQSDVPPWLRLDFSQANAARAAARKLAGEVKK